MGKATLASFLTVLLTIAWYAVAVFLALALCFAALSPFIDTSGGELEMDMGHLDNPDLTVTLDYETAKAILVDQNPQAGMQAFMAGKIKVEGDMTKLMAMQAGPPDPSAAEVSKKIQDITE